MKLKEKCYVCQRKICNHVEFKEKEDFFTDDKGPDKGKE